jgi:outer membrane biosynthesis protein TonB
MASLLTLSLIVTACFLICVISVLFVRYRKISKRKDVRLSREEVMGRLFLRKIKSIGEAGKDPLATLKELGGIMRSFFSELFDIAYEFDYVELNEELGKRGIDESIRKDIIDYSMKTEEFQYGGKPLADADLSSLIEKSIIIIRSVSKKGPEPEAAPVAEAAPKPEAPVAEKKQSWLSTAIDGFIRQPLPERKKVEKEKEEPEKEVPEKAEEIAEARVPEPAAVRRPVPSQAPEAQKRPAAAPLSTEGPSSRVRRLLLKAEGAVSLQDAGTAAEAYSELRGIYESLTQDQKRDMQDETRRIIALYNALLGEYKNSLSASKSTQQKS